MFAFGRIDLTRFPFTDLAGAKRCSLVVSRDNDRQSDLVVCFITSIQRSSPDMAPTAPTAGTCRRLRSVVRFDKLATLDHSVIADRIGEAPLAWLGTLRATFFGMFCIDLP